MIVVVSGQREVEDRKLVPSERMILPAVPAVAGYVAVDQLGAAFAPERGICPAVAVPARIAKAVPFEYTIPPLEAVRLALVPPLASGNGVLSVVAPDTVRLVIVVVAKVEVLEAVKFVTVVVVKVEAPVTPKVPDKVVLPVTPNVPPTVVFPVSVEAPLTDKFVIVVVASVEVLVAVKLVTVVVANVETPETVSAPDRLRLAPVIEPVTARLVEVAF